MKEDLYRKRLDGQERRENKNMGCVPNKNPYYYHTDHLGTPILMTDKNKNVVWNGELLPFGEVYSITGTIINNLRFPGQYLDKETGLNQNWQRDYHPPSGTYRQTDPIGLLGGLNLYSYGNNPVNWIDPTGLNPFLQAIWQRIAAVLRLKEQ